MEYNSFGQLTKESQEHSGLVTSSSLNVQYAYADGSSSSNQARATGMTYPNGRVISPDYGTTGGLDDVMNRVNAIKDGTTTLAAYTYLGSGTVVRIDYPQPTVMLDLWGGTSGTFAGIDRFGRVIDHRWRYYGTTPADRDRYQYGYDRNSNRIWKQNCVGSNLDEYYTYDDLNRLTNMDRGTLNAGKTAIDGTPAYEQDWTLDPTGNWSAFQTKTNGTTDLNQTRSANPVNEITAIGGTPDWADPTYDAVGNTITFPKTDNPTQSLSAFYDAWNRMTQVSDGSNSALVTDWAFDLAFPLSPAGGLAAILATPIPKPPGAHPPGSGQTTLGRRVFGKDFSNIIKRPFGKPGIGRVTQRAVPIVGWLLLLWDVAAASACLRECMNCTNWNFKG